MHDRSNDVTSPEIKFCLTYVHICALSFWDKIFGSLENHAAIESLECAAATTEEMSREKKETHLKLMST